MWLLTVGNENLTCTMTTYHRRHPRWREQRKRLERRGRDSDMARAIPRGGQREKRLSNSKSAVFHHTVVPCRCHRTTMRWLHDGIARASRSRVAFLRQSDSFLFPSYCLCEPKRPDGTDDHTKITRFDKMLSRWPCEGQNGHTNSTRKWTFARSFGNFLACQRFYPRSRSCCRSLINSTGGDTMAKMH